MLLVDRDREALDQAKERLRWEAEDRGERDISSRLSFSSGKFSQLSQHLKACGWPDKVGGGILADFGVSSLQLGEADRGFSFMHDGPMDMRMDRTEDAGVSTLLLFFDRVFSL